MSATIFWLKTRARWKETSTQEHTGAEGGPILRIVPHVALAKPREGTVSDGLPAPVPVRFIEQVVEDR